MRPASAAPAPHDNTTTTGLHKPNCRHFEKAHYFDGIGRPANPLTYPNAEVLSYKYGSAASAPDKLSRVDTLEETGPLTLIQYL